MSLAIPDGDNAITYDVLDILSRDFPFHKNTLLLSNRRKYEVGLPHQRDRSHLITDAPDHYAAIRRVSAHGDGAGSYCDPVPNIAVPGAVPIRDKLTETLPEFAVIDLVKRSSQAARHILANCCSMVLVASDAVDVLFHDKFLHFI